MYTQPGLRPVTGLANDHFGRTDWLTTRWPLLACTKGRIGVQPAASSVGGWGGREGEWGNGRGRMGSTPLQACGLTSPTIPWSFVGNPLCPQSSSRQSTVEVGRAWSLHQTCVSIRWQHSIELESWCHLWTTCTCICTLLIARIDAPPYLCNLFLF